MPLSFPDYYEAKEDGFKTVENRDQGIGDNAGAVYDHFLSEVREEVAKIENLDFSTSREDTQLLVNGEEQSGILYEKVQEGYYLPIAAGTVLTCNNTSTKGRKDIEKVVKVPRNGDIEVNIHNIWESAKSYNKGY